MVWYKAKWLPPLFQAVDAVAPNRLHDQDGTIGDLAHATGVSGHNPDDTPGVRAERQDADNIPEVRAGDVDARLRSPLLTMETIVQAVLGSQDDLARLIYIIYNRRIWRAANGWREEPYTGDDPHDKHAHFSGHPDADEDGRPWASILALLEEDEDMGQSFGPTQLNREGATSLCIPPVQAGTADPREVWLNAGGDLGGANGARLRVWGSNGARNGQPADWFPVGGGMHTLYNGEVLSLPLPKGLRLLSVQPFGLKDGDAAPNASISVCFERK